MDRGFYFSKPFTDKIEQLLNEQKPTPKIEDVFAGLRKFLEKLLEEALGLAIKTEMLPEKFSGTNYAENKAVTELLAASEKINSLVDSNPQYWHILLDGKTKGELAIYKTSHKRHRFPKQELDRNPEKQRILLGLI
jgi:hypothetical protein